MSNRWFLLPDPVAPPDDVDAAVVPCGCWLLPPVAADVDAAVAVGFVVKLAF